MKKTFIIYLVTILLLPACRKDKAPLSLKGNWKIETMTTQRYENGILNYNNTTTTGWRLNFQDDGFVVESNINSADSYPYILTGNNVQYNGDTYEIRDLTSNTVTLFNHETTSPGFYTDLFLNLKR